MGKSGEKGGIVFIGTSALSLDAKGRLAIPVKYREALAGADGEGLVVTVAPEEPCLWLYPKEEWEPIAEKVARLPTFDRQNRNLQRLLFGRAEELKLDSQGRILLSKPLREYAGLQKRVALVGQVHRFEIWDADRWNNGEWLEELSDESLSESLASLSL